MSQIVAVAGVCRPYPDSIKLDLDGCERYPLTMAYLLNLRDRDFEKWVIPADIIGSLEDYLEALIAIKTRRDSAL